MGRSVFERLSDWELQPDVRLIQLRWIRMLFIQVNHELRQPPAHSWGRMLVLASLNGFKVSHFRSLLCQGLLVKKVPPLLV